MGVGEPLGVALVGCGTVGTAVARVLTSHADRLAARAGRPIRLEAVAVRDANRARDEAVPAHLITADLEAVLGNPSVHVVAELMGGVDGARRAVLRSLAAGKHVVTANKALLAACGPELFAAARSAKRAIGFEAAVAGGVPIVRALAESLAANQVTALRGILNGTSNYILSSMADRGASYESALAEAQRLGYAEADPTLDVAGSDAADKLAVLAQIAFGIVATRGDIDTRGVASVESVDVRIAGELGYAIKLLAEAWTDGADVALHVAPVLVRRGNPLAQVRGASNAVVVLGDVVGETLYQGPGAGGAATASAVVADLIDLAVGRAQVTFAAAKLWSGESRGYSLQPSERVRSRFYLRLSVKDEPGVLATVGAELARRAIGIASVIQHEPEVTGAVTLVILTHLTETGLFRRAARAIDTLPSVLTAGVHYAADD